MAPVTFMCYICLLRATSLLFSLCVRNGSCDFHGFHDLYMFAVTKKGIVLSAFKQLQQRQAKHAAVWLCHAKTDGATSSLCRASGTGATNTFCHASGTPVCTKYRRFWFPRGGGVTQHPCRANRTGATSSICRASGTGTTKTACHASCTPSCTKSRWFWFPRGGGATQRRCRANLSGATGLFLFPNICYRMKMIFCSKKSYNMIRAQNT